MSQEWIERLIRLLPDAYQEYATYPGFWERVDLVGTNVPVLMLLILLMCTLRLRWFDPLRATVYRLLWATLAMLPWVVRTFASYAYDTPVGLLCLLVDIATAVWLAYSVGRRVTGASAPFDRFLGGLAGAVLAATLLILLRANMAIGIPGRFVHLLVSSWLALSLGTGRIRPADWWGCAKDYGLPLGICLLPFLPNLFTASVPDADITSMTEIAGFLFQGQSLSKVTTGIAGEVFSIGYPAGFPSLLWLLSHLLNLRASESALILWAGCYGLVVFGLVRLAKTLRVSTWVTALFALNLGITGFFGLAGGQVQELLAYACGFGVVAACIERDKRFAALCLSASLLMHPVVAVPFALVLGASWVKDLCRERNLHAFLLPGALLGLSMAYLAHLSTGPRLAPSQPSILLSLLTPEVFGSNVVKCLREDTFGLFPTLLVLPVVAFLRKREPMWLPMVIWGLGAVLIDGLFGHTLWTARFQGSLSSVGPWILSVALLATIATARGGDARGWQVWVGTVVVGTWLFCVAPGFRLVPGSVFTTHSDIRMGRYIERALGEDVLIANIKPHGDYGSRYLEAQSFNSVRGDCARDTVFARMGTHQVKDGALVDRAPYHQAISLPPSAILSRLATLGVTHVLVASRPGTSAFVSQLEENPMHRIGETYLFSLAGMQEPNITSKRQSRW